jgi:serine/threonine protein kinase
LAALADEPLPEDRAERVRALLCGEPRSEDGAVAETWAEFQRRTENAPGEPALLAQAEDLLREHKQQYEAALAALRAGQPLPALAPGYPLDEDYFGEVLAHARDAFPAAPSAPGPTQSGTVISTIFSSFFEGLTSKRHPDWHSQDDLWYLLVAVARARAGGDTPPEPSRDFALVLGRTCEELLGELDGLQREVAHLKLRRLTDEEVAAELRRPEDEVRHAIEAVRLHFRAKLEEAKADRPQAPAGEDLDDLHSRRRLEEFDSAWGNGQSPNAKRYADSHPDPNRRERLLQELQRRQREYHEGLDRQLKAFAERLQAAPPVPQGELQEHVCSLLVQALAGSGASGWRRTRLLREFFRRSLWHLHQKQVTPKPGAFFDAFPDPDDRATLAEAFYALDHAHAWRFAFTREVINGGGMGQILGGRDLLLGRDVALKRVAPSVAPGHKEVFEGRLQREAEILASLDHPGIPNVYGVGRDGTNALYFAMERLNGRTLHEEITEFHQERPNLCRRNNPRFLRLLRWFLDACAAVGYAHQRDILHRDLKPRNIMVCGSASYVIDWGLAKRRAEQEPSVAGLPAPDGVETLAAERVGTPEFMSPEQARYRTKVLTPAADVFSLGASLFNLLTGARPAECLPEGDLDRFADQAVPFEGEQLELPSTSDSRSRDAASEDSLVGAIRERVQRKLGDDALDSTKLHRKTTEARLRVAMGAQFPPPRAENRHIDLELERICRRAMAPDPKLRYQTAGELAEAIDRWLRDEPQGPSPLKPERRLFWLRTAVPRFVRRYLAFTVALFILLAAALVLAVGYGVQQRNQQRLVDLNEQTFSALVDLSGVLDKDRRKELSNKRWEFYQGFLDKTADLPSFSVQRAEARRSLVEVHLREGRLGDAAAELQLAAAELGPRATMENRSGAVVAALARTLHKLGEVLADLRNFDEAHKAYEESISNWRRLATDGAHTQDAWRGMARAWGFRGDMYWDRSEDGKNPDDLDRAARDYESSHKIRTEIYKKDAPEGKKPSSNEEAQRRLDATQQYGHSLNNMARAAWGRWWIRGGRAEEANAAEVQDALAKHREALGLQRQIVRDAPDAESREEARADVARTLEEMARLQRRRGVYDDAEKLYVEAAKIFDELLKKDRQVDYRQYKIRVAVGGALCRYKQGIKDEAGMWQGLGSRKDVEQTFAEFKDEKAQPLSYKRATDAYKAFLREVERQ